MFTNVSKHVFHKFVLLFVVLSLILAPSITQKVRAAAVLSIPADLVGYIDHSYGDAVKDEPTEAVPQSKLWWNDGTWWGTLFDPADEVFKIYKLDLLTQEWEATGVVLDSRTEIDTITLVEEVATSFDVLWDDAANKLYIASHLKRDNPSHFNTDTNWGRLYRYTYNGTTYTLDTGYPVTVNEDKTASLVLDKDSEARLWVTYVTRINMPDPTPDEYHVMVSYTETGDSDWAEYPNEVIDLSTINGTNKPVTSDDISSVIAFDNREKIGVMWSNQIDGNFYFAWHNATSAPASGWTVQTIDPGSFGPIATHTANDHIKLVTNAAGDVFATVKTENPSNTNESILGVLARANATGAFTFHQFSTATSLDTRPSLVLDETTNELVMFAASNEAGGVICYKKMNITSPLSSMAFPAGNCSNDGSGAPIFIGDTTVNNANDPTTSKHNVNNVTGIAALAIDDDNGSVYLHNAVGDFTPDLGNNIFMPMIYK